MTSLDKEKLRILKLYLTEEIQPIMVYAFKRNDDRCYNSYDIAKHPVAILELIGDIKVKIFAPLNDQRTMILDLWQINDIEDNINEVKND